MSADKLQSRLPDLVGALIGSVSLVALTSWSWRQWADVQVDFGRELYVPWRLAEGATLYRDLSYFNGPLSPYLNSLGFRLVGVGYSTIIGMNVLVLAIACVLLYLLLRRAGDRLSAFVGMLSLIWVFAFQHLTFFGNYNWISPYSHEITHGIALSLAALLAAARARRWSSISWYLVTGALVGMVFLTKAEVFLAAAAGVGVMVGWSSADDPAARRRGLAVLLAAAATPPVAAWALLALSVGAGPALIGVLGSWTGTFSGQLHELAFYSTGMGFDAPGTNLLELSKWSIVLAAILGAFVGLDRLFRTPRVNRPLAVAAALSVLAALVFVDVDWGSAPRPLPLIVLAGAAWTTLQLSRPTDEDRRQQLLSRLSLCVFAFAMLLKMLLSARVHHYGFALAMPAFAVSFAMFTGWIPEALRGWTRGGTILRLGAIGLLLGTTIAYLRISDFRYSDKRHGVGQGADRMLADPVRGPGFELTLDEIEKRFPLDATLLVLPEGVSLNYLARRRSPTPYLNFMPPELLLFGEDEIIDALERTPPDGVVLIHKDTTEYGAPLFGTHYGRKIMLWVEQHYGQVHLIGNQPFRHPQRFGVAILARKGAPEGG